MGQVLGAIVALGFLILVHEAGHLIVARWCGMKVDRFSIGFGPALIKWRSKKDTVYQIAPIFFGGFAEIRGMNLAEESDPDDPTSYANRPVWARMAAIFAGPFTNILTAVVLALILYSCHGFDRQLRYYEVNTVEQGWDAHGKLLPGDRILAVDGMPVYIEGPVGEYRPMTPMLREDRPASLTVLRKGELQAPILVQPRMDKCPTAPDTKCPRLGIRLQDASIDLGKVELGFFGALREAVVYPWRQSKLILGGLWQVVTRKAELETAGAVGITVVIKKAIETGWVQTFELLMMLNVYLGLFNLFPLPPLDGARLAFLGYELVTRRRANPKVEATVFMIGVLILIPVLIMVTVGDCRRVF